MNRSIVTYLQFVAELLIALIVTLIPFLGAFYLSTLWKNAFIGIGLFTITLLVGYAFIDILRHRWF